MVLGCTATWQARDFFSGMMCEGGIGMLTESMEEVYEATTVHAENRSGVSCHNIKGLG